MKVFRWGTALAVELPASLVVALDLKDGDEVEIGLADGGPSAVCRDADVPAVLARLRAYRERLPAGYRAGCKSVRQGGRS